MTVVELRMRWLPFTFRYHWLGITQAKQGSDYVSIKAILLKWQCATRIQRFFFSVSVDFFGICELIGSCSSANL